MKLPLETDDSKINRKLLKPQVERRRRERINRSLESLRTLLLQGPQQKGVSQRRVEKAEILEHTVLFLQNTAGGDNRKTESEGHQHPFQHGFSACLQRAAQFLGPQGESLSLAAAVNATFAARMARSACVGKVAAKTSSSSSLPSMTSLQSIPQLMQKTPQIKHGHRVYALNKNSFSLCNRVPLKHRYLRVPQQPQRPNHPEIRTQSRVSPNETQSQSLPASQCLWKPWP